MTPAIEFSEVRKRYGRTVALDGLSFRVELGSICGLVGSNGAGKTTTMAIAGGALLNYKGRMSILGQSGFQVEALAGRVTMIPQDSELPRYTRVRDLLYYYARLQGLSQSDSRRSVRDVLEWTNLADRAKSPIRSLSHGMKRRVTVAQAFLGNPELVLLDEPMNGLDPAEKANIRDLLKSRAGAQTIVVSSHNLDEVERVCDSVVFVEHGALVAQRPMGDDVLSCQVRYLLRDTLPDLTPVLALIEGMECHQNEEKWLTCRVNSALDVAEMNKQVLSWLLARDLGVIKVEPGVSLEQIYLDDIRGKNRR